MFLLNICVKQISTEVFTLGRLGMSKNNVRPKEWLQLLEEKAQHRAEDHSKLPTSSDVSLDISLLEATPDYNAAILEDVAMLPLSQTLANISSMPNVRDAVILCKVTTTACERSLVGAIGPVYQ